MRTIEEMLKGYEFYGLKPPIKGKYKRDKNRIYFSGDFQDEEEIYFWHSCEKPSANAIGNAFYKNKKGDYHLINIKEVEEIK
jgi:hypothetical protein